MSDSFQLFLDALRLQRDAELARLHTRTHMQRLDRTEFKAALRATLGLRHGYAASSLRRGVAHLLEFKPDPEAVVRVNSAIVHVLGREHPLFDGLEITEVLSRDQAEVYEKMFATRPPVFMDRNKPTKD